MTATAGDLIIGIDAGTSVIKSVAFTLSGEQVAVASVPNRYSVRADGAAVQNMDDTWSDCAQTLRDLGEKVENLAHRVAAVAVTAQGDGTWLVDRENRPVTDAWLWLDARAAPYVARVHGTAADLERYEKTGAGMNACQMGAQLAFMKEAHPEWIERSDAALHGKDWLYLNLTGVRATGPCEAVFTFGDYRTRRYDDTVIAAYGLLQEKRLLPDILDGSETTHPLSDAAATATGLLPGTPVTLGFLDVPCTALGGGIYTDGTPAGCTIIGTTGMHMRATRVADVSRNDELTGYVMPLPIPDMVAQIQSNMASTLNIDWLLKLAGDLMRDFGHEVTHADMVARIDTWLSETKPASMLYHPYISEAGERGPFSNSNARAAFTGLRSVHGFADLVRAVVEGIGHSARDCYETMGDIPPEIRLTGGAARSRRLRATMSACIGSPVRAVAREEAGAAGAAMMAAKALGVYATMDDCIRDWVVPTLGAAEPPDPGVRDLYGRLFQTYRDLRHAATPAWDIMASIQEKTHA